MRHNGPFIATAAWSIPKTVAGRFPKTGSGLERYAAVFNGVEINSTFYRHHQKKTFVRWASAVPAHFLFAVKIPRDITHEARLRNIGPLFDVFVDEISVLEGKLGPLLCQLPPSLRFDAAEAEEAFSAMRRIFTGPLVLEPRHKSWASAPARVLLQKYAIGRVLADPRPYGPYPIFVRRRNMSRCTARPKLITPATTMPTSVASPINSVRRAGASSTTRPRAPPSKVHW
ncbi:MULTISPECIES: DUF72 domain-containing protein [unclassified Shinella]|jgi:uncharacterized protein YecE (DUF72 family)|uniref:DUF72 domain-containing protein n=1 Tax=unclassified Shinella TaxID=2643062 RepID=UPI0003C56A39|nr:DUF72 domain-containing protein [Shinella sp. DD12]EYR77998.1 hypothetical protein SHLA_8c001230 [Shinella sp. DD12]